MSPVTLDILATVAVIFGLALSIGSVAFRRVIRRRIVPKIGSRHSFALFAGMQILGLGLVAAGVAWNMYSFMLPLPTSGPPEYAVIRVYYGTDRNRTGSEDPEEVFGSERGDLSVGFCDVSIPREHRLGELEEPSILRLEFREDPEKHVVLLRVVPQKEAPFFQDLKSRTETSKKREALVFVHGYNVTFEDAARRTAQMAYDLAFDGPAAFFSWPSKGTYEGYPADETTIAWATPHLKTFLEEIATNSEAKTVHLIAHSMGNRGLMDALGMIAESARPTAQSKFQEIVLAAPDIDKDIFVRDVFPRLAKFSSRVTLYSSSRDKALLASTKFHQYPRAGDTGDGLVIMKDLDTVDATHVDTSFIGHSYFAENRSVISDMFYLIGERLPPQMRFGLEPVKDARGQYWRFKQ